MGRPSTVALTGVLIAGAMIVGAVALIVGAQSRRLAEVLTGAAPVRAR